MFENTEGCPSRDKIPDIVGRGIIVENRSFLFMSWNRDALMSYRAVVCNLVCLFFIVSVCAKKSKLQHVIN